MAKTLTKPDIDPTLRYSCNEALSYGCLFTWVLGERGNGKTFDFKKWCIKDFLKNGNQFMWVRRYATELDDINLFFDDIVFLFPDHTFKVGGGHFYIDNKVAGFYVPLSKQVTKKSTPYPRVTKMIYDEFLITKKGYRYIPNEPDVLMELYSSVDRYRGVRLVCIANSTTIMNPYFAYFDVPELTKRFTRIGKDIIIEMTDTIGYREAVKETPFGRIIANTKYGRYAIDNEFSSDNKEFLSKKTDSAKNIFNLKIGDITIGIWLDSKIGKLFASWKFNPQLACYTILLEDLTPNLMIITGRSYYMKLLKNMLQMGGVYYEDMKIKTLMYEVIKVLSIK